VKIGKKLEEINDKKIVPLNDKWYTIHSKEFPRYMKYSKYYTYLPIQETIKLIEQYLKKFSDNIVKKSTNTKYTNFTRFKFTYKDVDFLLFIVNSTNKTRAFRLDFYASLKNEKILKKLFSHRKIHKGNFDIKNFMNKFIELIESNLSNENIQKIIKFKKEFDKIILNQELIKNLFKDFEKSYYSYLNSLYYYFKTKSSDELKLSEILQKIYNFYLFHSKSKLNNWNKFIDLLIDKLIKYGMVRSL